MKKVLSIALSLVLLIGCMAMATISADAARTPRYTVLVLDVSGSMRWDDKLEAEQEAAKKFCKIATENPDDKVAVVTFSTTVDYVGEFTNDIKTLNEEIENTYPDGYTNFYDSLAKAKELLDEEAAKDVKFERNIVFCSDGIPENGETLEEYKYTYEDYAYSYQYGNAALKYDDENIKPTTNVYTIGFFQGLYGQLVDFAPMLMKDLANKLSVVAETEDELIEAFSDFAEEITKVEPVETPETPDNASSNNSSNNSSNSSSNSVQNPSNAASIAAAIQTGSPISFTVIMAAAFISFGAMAIANKKRSSSEK